MGRIAECVFKQSVPIAFVLAAIPVLGGDRIGDIEFYGYKGFDVGAVRSVLPVNVGDQLPDGVSKRIRDAVVATVGREPTDVALVCCDEQGDRLIFVGLPGQSTRKFRYDPEPSGDTRLSDPIVTLHRKLGSALRAAVRKGGDATEEDYSNGFALTKDAAAHSIQLAMHEYVLEREDELSRVLRSSADARHREIAAEALGYVRQSPSQIAALVRATRDSNHNARNNAARALGVLASSSSFAASEIGAANFIEMLSSGIWEDRNKASFVLHALTRSRDPRLLGDIRSNSLDSLIEMARWRSSSHAYSARMILGRIAGLSEKQSMDAAMKGTIGVMLNALRSSADR